MRLLEVRRFCQILSPHPIGGNRVLPSRTNILRRKRKKNFLTTAKFSNDAPTLTITTPWLCGSLSALFYYLSKEKVDGDETKKL